MPRRVALHALSERDLLSALRIATRAGHHRVEAQGLSQQMVHGEDAAVAYAPWLTALAPELFRLERCARAALADTDWATLLPAWRPAELLAADLHGLGRPGVASAAPRSRVGSLGSGVGALYVMTGSQLGARLLLRTLERADPAQQLPRRYLRAAAADPGWAALSARLADCRGAPFASAACRTARAAFARLAVALAEAEATWRVGAVGDACTALRA